MQYLDWEYSLSPHYITRIIDDGREMPPASTSEISALTCEAGEKLLRYYIPGKSSHYMRRTLGQSYYTVQPI